MGLLPRGTSRGVWPPFTGESRTKGSHACGRTRITHFGRPGPEGTTPQGGRGGPYGNRPTVECDLHLKHGREQTPPNGPPRVKGVRTGCS
ncbi:hypothetical protein ALC60_11120 [Trachymyrmex zeteki]|uniref:Uncharacterized protein n=1 Tax=Mycetomoellerius zeteki TaxID=64791 RepID=A0A151WPR8_9HYME|nr:hypothetical protein ALC60_11120 [Trachymyrmex zeteki]